MARVQDDLIERWIAANPHHPGSDEAWLPAYGISVWALVGYWQMVDGDIGQVAADYEIPREAVEAALAYYETHREVIQARLDANAA